MKYWSILLVLVYQGSYACSCFGLPSFEENIKSHEQIVIVELKKSLSVLLQTRYKANVTEVLKGENIKKLKPLKQGLTSCDPKLASGQRWLVFLQPGNNNFKPGWCGPHRVIGDLQNGSSDWREVITNN